ncbi:MAG: hypothetical protein HYW90_00890 [Candidatus Sungbacteria bacterium]|nr:hypothetical protein [Candidatus Sungbacteria bacterium]
MNNYTPTVIGGAEIGQSLGQSIVDNPIYVSGDYAFVGLNTGATNIAGTCSAADATGCELRILDISTSTPTHVGGIDVGASVYSVYVVGDTLYLGISASTTEREFLVYDVSNPSSPSRLGGIELGVFVQSIAISGRYAYVTAGDSVFRIVDISDLRNPIVVGSVSSGGSNSPSVSVSGRYAYITTSLQAGNEFQIVDISNPQNPLVISSLKLGAIGQDVFVSGSYAYVVKDDAGIAEDFIIYDISNPASPATTSAVALVTSARNIVVSGRYAYIGLEGAVAGDEFLIYDVSDPRSPVLIGSRDPSGSANPGVHAIFIVGKRAYIGTGSNAAGNEFQIFDLTGFEAQTVLAHSLEAGQAQIQNDLIVYGGLFGNSINTGSGGIFSRGPLSVFVASTTQVSPVSASFMGGSVGIGTSSPPARLTVTGRGTVTDWAFLVTDSASTTRFLIQDNGTIGIGGTTSPYGILTVEIPSSADSRTPIFVVGDEGTTSPPFIITSADYTKYGFMASTTELTSPNVPGGSMIIGMGALCVDNGGSNCDDAARARGVVHSTAADVTNIDVAENYPTQDLSLKPGELVVIDTKPGDKCVETGEIDDIGTIGCIRTETSPIPFVSKSSVNNKNLIGVVSTEPGVLLGGFAYKSHINYKQVPVALVGRVPVKVSLEGGPINPGDRITLSSEPGIGAKATTSGQTVGIALESFDGTIQSGLGTSEYSKTGKILVFVNLGYAKLDEPLSSTNYESDTNLRITNAWSIDQSSGKVSVNFFGDLRLNGNSIVDVKAITGMWGKWSIDENGKVVAKEVETENLFVKKQATFGTTDAPSGITIYDRVTKQPVCVFSENGALRSEAGACGTTGNQESGIMNQGTSTTETQDTIVESGTSNPELGTSNLELGTEATTTEPAFAGATADKPVVILESGIMNNELGSETDSMASSTDSISSPQADSAAEETQIDTSALASTTPVT